MKALRRLIFGFVLVAGLSVVASAQKDQKPPPKERPPVVKPQPKPPPDNSDKGKKPGEAAARWKRNDNFA
jgi:hypothetical protein